MPVPIARLYVLKIFSKHLALSLFIFCSLLLMFNFVQIVDKGVLGGFSLYFLAKGMVYMLPGVVASALPLAFLLAMLLSLGAMSQDGEIIALRAGGFSFYEIFSCVLYAALLSVLLLLLLNNWLAPNALKRSTDYTISMASRITKIELKPRTFQQISEWTLYADSVNALSGEMRGVKLLRRIEKNGAAAYVNKINAAAGRYRKAGDSGLELELADGQFSQTDSRDQEKLLYGGFSSYKTLLPFFSESSAARVPGYHELTTPALLKALKAGVPDSRTEGKFRVESVSRSALALAPLVFFLVGAPLGVALDKRGRSAGFGLSLLIIFLYYGLTISGVVLARKDPAFFPWLLFAPALVTGGAGAWLWKRRLYAK